MWVIFLLSAFVFAIAAVCLIWVANKVYLSMKKDEAKAKKEIEEENTKE